MTTPDTSIPPAAARIAQAYAGATALVAELAAGTVWDHPIDDRLRELRAAREQIQALELALQVFADLEGPETPAWATTSGPPRWPDASAPAPTPVNPADDDWDF